MLALDVTLCILSGLLGLVFGSFLNVCIYRIPRGEFFSRKRSYCPQCGAGIKARDNIPVLSYILLKGRCRNCGRRISPRYPIVELVNCALWVGNYAAFGLSGMTLVWDVAMSVLVVAAFCDLDTMEIPDSGIVVLLILGAITFAPFGGVSWQDKLIGCACVSVPMFVLFLFGGMGFGDVKLFFVLGLLLGWKKILVVLMFAVVTGAVAAVVNLAVRRRRGEASEESGEDSADGGVNTIKSDGAEDADEPRTDAVSATRENGREPSAQATEPVLGDAVSEPVQQNAKNAENGVYTNETMQQNAESCNVTDEEEEDELLRKAKSGRALPFGPFIALATVVAAYFGDAIINLYAELLGL